MSRALQLSLLCLAISLSTVAAAAFQEAESEPDEPSVSSIARGLKFRSIGPALMSGRIADIAIDPVKPNTWYVAAGSGNLWKTVNAGTTWTPIFDDQGSYSIGCVAIDPSNRHTIWVGTGENVGGRHVGYGDGVYVSHDGGQSFTNVGLKETEHISKILIDPRDSNVVYVAAQGPLWSSGGERGLYKTTDGGATWAPILTRGEWTGVTDVVMDPSDPDVLYAATHQRHRTVWALVNGGPESGIHKSTDGGAAWTELKKGLPAADKGKMSLAVSHQRPEVVYATIELAGRTGGIWRSENHGASWTKMSDYTSGGTGPHYYQELYIDPHRFDVLYHANVRLGRTTDGGRTFESVGNPNKHVDNHAVAFHPTDPDFLLVGCDGGLYRSWDFGATYAYCANLPLTQFYKVDVDYDEPFYHVVGGTQDNNTQWGPTRTKTNIGIRNADWRITIGGDGHDCAIDPKDPNVIYSESQEGYLRRFDRLTGESIDIRPRPEPGEEELRFNWDSPLLISPHSHTRLYFGSKKLHRSDDRGDSWTTISPDLSRNIDRFTLPHMGRVWSIDSLWDLYAMSQYGNITSISESPLEEGLIYVGTDDGLIQATEDGGRNWRRIDAIPGIPAQAFVNDVKADLHDADTVYAVFDDHKTGDFEPYVVRSRDRGRTWESIVSDLPERHLVWRIIQDHVDADLLFLGTEFGVFYSRNAGAEWQKLAGAPNIPFRDLEIQRRENDLVGATFGRGFYVMDDYSPLREIDEDLLEVEFKLFPIRNALLYVEDRPLGRPKGSQGDSYFTAKNPPFGAVFTYYLREDVQTRKAKREEQEKEIKEAGGDNTYPGWDALKKEEREDDPVLTFTITDAEGDVVRRITGPTKAGLHRIAWDLRYADPTGRDRQGPLVVPGVYRVSATKRVDDQPVELGAAGGFEVVAIGESALPRQDREAVLAFQMDVGALQKQVVGTTRRVTEALAQVDEIKTVVGGSRALNQQLFDDARAIELQLLDIQERLSGDQTRARRSQTAPLSISQRVNSALSGTLRQTYGPTQTHRRQYEIGRDQFAETLTTLRTLLEGPLQQLFDDLDAAGAPWTTGRKLPAAGG